MKLSNCLLLNLALTTNIAFADSFFDKLSRAAIDRTHEHVIYDGSYQAISYPNGDVAKNKGVCTDVVIRAYRTLGIDLQKAVHEDMQENFQQYPARRIWGQKRPDSNIDHRRVPNLQVFFKRFGQELSISQNPQDYKAGDIVTWMLPGNLPHIGVVTHKKANRDASETPLIAHNIGSGPELDNMLFDYPITGHYRFK